MDGTKKERKARSRSANAADSDNTRAISYRYACVSVQENWMKDGGRTRSWVVVGVVDGGGRPRACSYALGESGSGTRK